MMQVTKRDALTGGEATYHQSTRLWTTKPTIQATMKTGAGSEELAFGLASCGAVQE